MDARNDSTDHPERNQFVRLLTRHDRVIRAFLRSLLLQFNPVDPADRQTTGGGLGSRMRRIEGSITFDRPVIGLIVTSEKLRISDEVFDLRRGPTAACRFEDSSYAIGQLSFTSCTN